jgi:sugar phosphate isomerase/epimerase
MKKYLLILVSILLLVVGVYSQTTQLNKKMNPGVVSYTFRNSFQQNVEATLDSIKSMGLINIEFSSLFGKTAEEMKKLLDERGLFCSSYGVGYADITNKPEEVGQTAKTLGASFVRVAWIPHDSTGFTVDVATKAAEDFNKAGKFLKEKFGIQFCFHNHGYEFAPYEKSNLFDYLMAKTDPAFVGIEMDILWVYFPGQDPVTFIQKYGKRIKLMHLKDLKKGVKGNVSGGTSGQNNVPLGTGQLDLPGIIKAAAAAGVKYYFIEDESDRVFVQVPLSIEYLKKSGGPF